eukprot:gene3710-4230_t
MKLFNYIWMVIYFYWTVDASVQTKHGRSLQAEEKEGSFLVQRINEKEYNRLQQLLGIPIGDAMRATATNGTQKVTKFIPKCPKKLSEAPEHMHRIFLQKCPDLQKLEYRKQEKQVASIILKASVDKVTKSYAQQKKNLISAINKLAKVAGPLPSL